MTDKQPMEPTDDELDELRQANSGRLNFVTFREFRVIARAVLAKWGAQHAGAQEPVAWRVYPFDYGVGSEGVYAMTALTQQRDVWERRGWKTEPLYTASLPSPAAQGDALDAERLDWLTFNLSGKALRDIGVVWSEHGDARRAIDAARTAQEGK